MVKSARAQAGQPSKAELEEALQLLLELEAYAKNVDPTGTVADKVKRIRQCFYQEGE